MPNRQPLSADERARVKRWLDLTLSSDALGLIAKLDLIGGSGFRL